ncbi:glycoside hydrolase family protein [Cryptosporangium arvum]|uniref:glycoside hydrolase family protein n=1 Tax=Cryptosporangium arvum TaxID=80871 RepID=UPI001B808BFA|nr:glycoside hydrolase family protein [Cryptosporangium arvum]
MSRRALLILAVCLGVVVAAVGGWAAKGSGGPAAPVAAVIDPTPSPSALVSTAGSTAGPTAGPTAGSTAGPRVSVGPAQAGAGASPSAARPRAVSGKRGAALNNFGAVKTALGDSGAGWYYTWGTDPVPAPAGVSFTPMIWGEDSVDERTLSTVKQRGDTLLGFNEPDFASQSNLSPARALELWPSLQDTGMRLGSPAPAFGAATDGSWFDQFMTGARAKGYRVDFIALHWYGGDFTTANAVRQLRSYLQAVHDRWNKPIWLTEYALIDFSSGTPRHPSPEQQAAFVTASTAMMDGLPFVERYSWFIFSPGNSGTSLYASDGSPTTIGRAYRR